MGPAASSEPWSDPTKGLQRGITKAFFSVKPRNRRGTGHWNRSSQSCAMTQRFGDVSDSLTERSEGRQNTQICRIRRKKGSALCEG